MIFCFSLKKSAFCRKVHYFVRRHGRNMKRAGAVPGDKPTGPEALRGRARLRARGEGRSWRRSGRLYYPGCSPPGRCGGLGEGSCAALHQRYQRGHPCAGRHPVPPHGFTDSGSGHPMPRRAASAWEAGCPASAPPEEPGIGHPASLRSVSGG